MNGVSPDVQSPGGAPQSTVATLILGWGLCCCYLGKHFYTTLGDDKYTEMKEDWRDAKLVENGTGRDRLESLLLLKDKPVALRRPVRTGD